MVLPYVLIYAATSPGTVRVYGATNRGTERAYGATRRTARRLAQVRACPGPTGSSILANARTPVLATCMLLFKY
eukprot:2005886-Rhodomonas_salina.4